MLIQTQVIWLLKYYPYPTVSQSVLPRALTSEAAGALVLKQGLRASLVVQWLRIHLPMQGTQFRALVREDTTCRGATKPVHHNY